jgi:LCP family protein required for cell wall assembly
MRNGMGRRRSGGSGRDAAAWSNRPGSGRARRAGPSSRRQPGQGWRGWQRFRRKSTLAQIGYVAVTVSAVLAVVAAIGAFKIYEGLVGNITKITVGGLTNRAVAGVQNILVVGSQERQGQVGGARYFGYELDPWTTNSDNLLLIHLDKSHTHATVLSIPRDTMVYEPGCKARISKIGYGIQGPYQSTIIDGALNIGGPTCAVETVEDLTGIKLDHFVEFDFNSFRTMVNTLGGVEVCVPYPGYHDADSHLNLSPGRHRLFWDQALAYVRDRHGLGGQDAGGDLPRIQVQQAFISSVVQQVDSTGLLANSLKLLKIAETATKSLTVDNVLGSTQNLLSLARSLAHMRSSDVNLITMPTITDTSEYGRLLPEEPQDDVLFQMIRTGQQWHGHLPLARPGQVQVRVLNGTGVGGLAASTATNLRKLGFDVIGIGDAAPTANTVVSYAGTVQADSAYTLMSALDAFPAAQNLLQEPAGQLGTPGAVTLTLGDDYAGFGVKAPHPGKAADSKPAKKAKGKKHRAAGGGSVVAAFSPPSGAAAVESRNAAANICSGLPPASN